MKKSPCFHSEWMQSQENNYTQNCRQQKNLQLLNNSATKLARTCSAWGTESGMLNR